MTAGIIIEEGKPNVYTCLDPLFIVIRDSLLLN